jgi:uncharacterized protein with PIN domain
MPSCLACGGEMKEVSRKIIKGEVSSGRPNYKVLAQCPNPSCARKGVPTGFLDDGMMFIPLPDHA